MLIALSSSGESKNSTLDHHFGRCAYFAFYDDEKDEWRFEPNEAAKKTSGAGIQAAQFVLDQKAEVIITGEVGPKAWQVLQPAPLEVFQLSGVTLEEAVQAYREGKARKMGEASDNSHTGAASSWKNNQPVHPRSGNESSFDKGRLAIATEQNQVAQHFGRCEGYTLVDFEGNQVIEKWFVPNPGHQPGFLPRFLGEKGIQCIIAGGMGPRAQQIFAELGISYVMGVTGPVDDTINSYITGVLTEGESLCDHGHHEHCDH